PTVVGDVEVGVEEEVILLEPEPHIPDRPEVCSIPEVVDMLDVGDIPGVDIPGNAIAPDVASVAGVAVPIPIPPPSAAPLHPYIPAGAVPHVDHLAPALGVDIVPVTLVGAGLRHGNAIPVVPGGVPVGQ